MASIFKRTRLIPIPQGAKIVNGRGRRVAKWTTKRDKYKTASVHKSGTKVVVESEKYYISFTDHSGRRQRIAGSADLPSTRRIAAKLEAKEAEYRYRIR